MSWIDIHKRRLLNDGGSVRDAYSLQTVNFIEHSFNDSPTFLKTLIDGNEYEARFLTDKKYSVASGFEVKILLFKPYTKVSNGKVALIKDRTSGG